jgi:AraC-like DNA-binding protein
MKTSKQLIPLRDGKFTMAKTLSWIYLSTIVILFLLFLSQNLDFLPIEIDQIFRIINGILVFSMFYLNVQGIQHYTLSHVYPSIINNLTLSPQIVLNKHEKCTNSNGSRRLNEEEKIIEADILSVIENEKLYLVLKFNIADLASRLELSRHKVSRIINAKENRTCYNLINKYRGNHLQQMLNDPNNLRCTILALGLESGFNSKASLNRIFKDFAGLTPKQHLDIKSQSVA